MALKDAADDLALGFGHGLTGLAAVFGNAAGHIAGGGVVICEHPFREELDDEIGGLKKYREYKYSKTAVTVYRKD